MKLGAIFDMDGILFDTEKLYQESWQEIAAEHGIRLKPDFNTKISGSSGELMNQILQEAYPGLSVEEVKAKCMEKMQNKLKKNVPVKPGVREILKYLKESGYALAVASSSSREMVLSNLEKTGLKAYFDVIAAKGSVEKGKPAPDIFLFAARQIGCMPTDCFVFEDSLQGVSAGVAAGCKVIMVPDLIAPNEMAKEKCTGICPDMYKAMEEIQKGRLNGD